MAENIPVTNGRHFYHKLDKKKLGNLLVSEKKYTVALALISAALVVFLSENHAVIPMWIEGIAEYQHILLVMLGFTKASPECWINIYDVHLPLAFNAYIGPVFFYFHLPPAYLWFNGFTNDPYVYRYMGILFFLADGWILYYLLRKFYLTSVSFYGAAAFLTSTFLACLTEAGGYFLMLFFVFSTAFLFFHYVKGGGRVFLLLAAAALGITMITRIEVFVWILIPYAIYLAVERPSVVLNRWRETRNKILVALGVVLSFCLGAGPTIIYNLICPSDTLFSLISTSIIPSTFGAAATPLSSKLEERVEQFWAANLLGIPDPDWAPGGFPNYIFGGLFLICVVLLFVRWIRHREASFFLIAIPTSILLSLVTRGVLRSAHLAIVQPAVLMIVVSGLAYLHRYVSLKKFANVGFVLLVLGNTVTSASNWLEWRNHPDTLQTVLNQSDPVMLADYLSRHHSSDQILYTNIGMPQYVQYMTRNRIKGTDILSWFNVDGFVNGVKLALLDKTNRRVFVAVGKERDGAPGTLPRTNKLYSVLKQYNIPFTVVSLSSERNRYLYELVTIDKGVTLGEEFSKGKAIHVSSVMDVRLVPQPAGNTLIFGSIHGTGFKIGDAILVDGRITFPTAFGNDTWITFAIPRETAENRDSFTLEVLRPGTLERSQPQTVKFVE